MRNEINYVILASYLYTLVNIAWSLLWNWRCLTCMRMLQICFSAIVCNKSLIFLSMSVLGLSYSAESRRRQMILLCWILSNMNTRIVFLFFRYWRTWMSLNVLTNLKCKIFSRYQHTALLFHRYSETGASLNLLTTSIQLAESCLILYMIQTRKGKWMMAV